MKFLCDTFHVLFYHFKGLTRDDSNLTAEVSFYVLIYLVDLIYCWLAYYIDYYKKTTFLNSYNLKIVTMMTKV